MKKKGTTWNESSVHEDPVTSRTVRRLTASGLWNEKPVYHTNTAFTADGEYMVFARADEGRTAVLKCHLPTGELTQLTDPVEGVGSSWGASKMETSGTSEFYEGHGISGALMCAAPRSRLVAYTSGRTVRTVHLDTFDESVLLEDFGDEWIDGVLSVDPAEKHVLVPMMPAHPDVRAGKETDRGYMECFAEGGMVTRYLEIDLASGSSRVVFEDEGMGCAHCPHCPTDDDLVLIDRDRAPLFWGGGDNSKSPRCWTLRLSNGELTELDPLDGQKFQVHAAWTWDGQYVAYHGWLKSGGGYYVGLIDRDGKVFREYPLLDAGAYGHVSAARSRDAIILDGNVTKDKLTWLYYEEEEPRFETIAVHGSQWDNVPGQYSHPHPTEDPTGRFIAYNVAKDGRTDVYSVEV